MDTEISMTPIYKMTYSDGVNEIYIKRDDLLPFSFGGNKVRIAEMYFKDMYKKGCNCIIAYGSDKSNMCRVITNMSKSKNIPCYLIICKENTEDESKTYNYIISNKFNSEVRFCTKENVSDVILSTINECKIKDYNPYYIYGDIYGNGNESIAVDAYVRAYNEIKVYSNLNNIEFDYIFHASGTGTTQAGLIAGKINNNDKTDIVGISIARKADIGIKKIEKNLEEYYGSLSNCINSINFCDKYILGGYGKYNLEVSGIIDEVLSNDGIALDPIYTGKAFLGMKSFLKDNKIEGKKVLFIHTGGLPIYFDYISKLNERR